MIAIEGGCACGSVRYRLLDWPMIVHACHCSYCQRETGTAFAVNALIEEDRVELLQGEPKPVVTPSASGAGHRIMRCGECGVAVWSYYVGMSEHIAFVRVGTLDEPQTCPPRIHVFTGTKQDWVDIPKNVERVENYYKGSDVVRLYGEDGALRLREVRRR